MSPAIVVLDGYTVNPGDLSWDELKKFGQLEVHDRTPADAVAATAANAEIILASKAQLDQAAIDAMPNLKYIGVLATGYNNVDVAAAKKQGIIVTNVPAYSTPAVAQTVFAHLLNLTQRVAEHAIEVRRGKWQLAKDWCYWDYPLVELEGATMGIVGMGRIGRATAKLAIAFGMKVIAASRSKTDWPDDVAWTDVDTVFRESDVVSLHCPLTDETHHLVNAQRLATMKPTAFLINTGRGPLVDEAALAAALSSGKLAGAGLDVLTVEPPNQPSPLFSNENCYVTPHLAWATKASRSRLMKVVIANVEAFLNGNPQNVVN